MRNDSFSDSFGAWPGSSWPSLRGYKMARKSDIAPEPEPEELIPESKDSEPEPPRERVVLKNPRWEIEKVGFNEETDISVDADLPPAHAHKTRVEFELFALTPNGPESISKSDGVIEDGKAKARIPVYMPKWRDEFGNLLRKVEYYFTAKHSESDLLKDQDKKKQIEELADPLLGCEVLPDSAFATGKSFPSPSQAETLESIVALLGKWQKNHAEGKMVIFGHADAMGKEETNKKLSERRAAAVYAFLLKDVSAWETLYNEDKWGLASTQELLKHFGNDPGVVDGKDGPKTQGAVKAYQSSKGLPATGQADAATRKSLYSTFMDAWNTGSFGAKDFDVIDGKAHGGCSEFNRFRDTNGDCAENRRVTIALLKSTKNFPIQYPCKHGDIAPCKGQVGRKGERRTGGFGCFFYDKHILESSPAANPKQKRGRVEFSLHSKHPFGFDPAEDMNSEDSNGKNFLVKGDPNLNYLSVESGKVGLVELAYDGYSAEELYLKLERPELAELKIRNPSENPFIIEIKAKSGEAVTETKIKACIGSAEGEIVSEIGLVLLRPLNYSVTYMRVEDPRNAKTRLKTPMTVAKLASELNRLYKTGAANWTVEGKGSVNEIEYETIRNGCLDLEPGVESVEWKKILAKCNKKQNTIVHVHELRWSFFLTKGTKATDTVIDVKDYGGSLDFIGKNEYQVEDGIGNRAIIKVAFMDKSKLQIHLERPIGVEFKLSDMPALVWPLGGLSGNPLVISDVNTPEDLAIYAAHELGHTLCGFSDCVEKANQMFGGSDTGEKLRYRPIGKYYYPGESESQWKIMRGQH